MKLSLLPALSLGIAAALVASLSCSDHGAPEHVYTTLPSGLSYTDLRIGYGPVPDSGQIVTVHYTGSFENGKVFDSSRDRGQPFSFRLHSGQVIKGFDEGVASMRVGGVRRMIIPPSLGYGPGGIPNMIPPNTNLVFEVELLSIM